MRYKSFFVRWSAVLFLMCTSVYAQNDQELFLQANELYAQQAYADARALYDSIADKGRAVWYNMGNCAYCQGDYVHALVYWKRAERYASYAEREAIQTNCTYAYKQLRIKSPQQQWYTMLMWLYPYICDWSPLVLQCILLLGLLLMYYLIAREKKQLLVLRVAYGVAFCAQLVWIVAVYQYTSDEATTRGYITTACAVYSGPDTRYAHQGDLSLATCVSVGKQKGDWCHVASDTCNGWVRASDIEVI